MPPSGPPICSHAELAGDLQDLVDDCGDLPVVLLI
jgi:hypothetical protein